MNKIRFETSGSLGILTLANPPLNLFSEELINDLRSAVTEVQHAPVRAMLVRAEGKIFSGGADVSVFRGRTASEARERFTSHVQLIADLEELPFPTLAAARAVHCGRSGTRTRMRPDMGRRLGALRSGRGIDWNDDAPGGRATPRRARRPKPRARNYLHRRPVRCGDV
jgi:hypothetical protein